MPRLDVVAEYSGSLGSFLPEYVAIVRCFPLLEVKSICEPGTAIRLVNTANNEETQMAGQGFFDYLSHQIDGFVDNNPGVIAVVAATAAQTVVDLNKGVVGILTGHGAETADWFDKRADQTQAAFRSVGDSIVDAMPNAGGAALATAFTAVAGLPVEWSRGYVDSARVGTGIAEGTWQGVGKDVLRALPFIMPAASKLATMRYASLAKAYVDPAEQLGACMSVSVTKALLQSGRRGAFAAMDDLVTRIARLKPEKAEAAFEEIGTFTGLDAKLSQLNIGERFDKTIKSYKQLEQFVRSRPNGTTVFKLHWNKDAMGKPLTDAAGKLIENGHSLYAYVDTIGRFRIADRSGSVVKSISELERMYKGYSGIAGAEFGSRVMHIPASRFLNTLQHGGTLGVAINAIRTTSLADLRVRARDFLAGKPH